MASRSPPWAQLPCRRGGCLRLRPGLCAHRRRSRACSSRPAADGRKEDRDIITERCPGSNGAGRSRPAGRPPVVSRKGCRGPRVGRTRARSPRSMRFAPDASFSVRPLAWPLAHVHKAPASPSDADQPGPRGRDGFCRVLRRADGSAPSVEPESRRARIPSARSREVFPEVLQHVDQRMPNFSRRAEQSGVIAIRPHLAATFERAVDRLGGTNRQAL